MPAVFLLSCRDFVGGGTLPIFLQIHFGLLEKVLGITLSRMGTDSFSLNSATREVPGKPYIR
jgi:hypothetical protein